MGRVQLFLLLLLYYQVKFLDAWNNERFLSDLLSEYKRSDQAGQADTNKDGVITDTEFANNLYKLADVQGFHDEEVTRDEFIDYYSLRYNVSSELTTIMFDYLNDQSQPDDVINSRDVSLMSFAGKSYISINEYRNVLEKWISQSAEKLVSILTSPSLISPDNSMEINYDYFINTLDANKDKVISLAEITQEINRMSTSGSVRRGDWVKRTTKTFDAHPTASQVVFDFWDKDRDLILSANDLQSVLKESDYNEDGIVGRNEFVRFLERTTKLSHRVTGTPIAHSLIQCPDNWWRDMVLSSEADLTRAIMDFDDDLNGWISPDDLDRWLDTFDENDDSFISRSEYTSFQWQRYRNNATTAAAMFVLADVNGDDKLDQDDWLDYFKGNLVVSFCDARNSQKYLISVSQELQQFAKGEELRAATKRRLKEEIRQFLQNEPSQPTTRTRDFCSGQVSCYVGEVTEEWWRPEAWLWWGSYLPQPVASPKTLTNPFAQRFPPLGGVRPLGIPNGFADFRGFSGSNWPQWPVNEFNSMSPIGGWGPFYPFKRSTNDPFRSRGSQESVSKSPKVSLLNPFRPQSETNFESATDQDLSPRSNNFANPGIQRGNGHFKSDRPESRNNWFQPMNGDDLSKQSQNNDSESPFFENVDKDPDTEYVERKGQNKSQGEDIRVFPGSIPFPPFMFNVDPWIASGYPFWPMFRRLKRDKEQKLLRHKRESEETNDGVRLEKKDSADNETAPWAYIRSWRPSFMMPPPMFSLPHWDPLLAWLAERDMWDSILAQEWSDLYQGNSSGSNSSTQVDELWEMLTEMRENSKGSKKEDQVVAASEKSGADNHDQQNLNKSRGKRFMGSDFPFQMIRPEWYQQLLFPLYGPYYNAQDWRARMPLISHFWPQYISNQNWAVNRGLFPVNFWTNGYLDLNFEPRYFQNFRVKRKASNEANTKENVSPGDRRDSPFNQWKASNTENDRRLNSEKSDSIWRSEEKKYQTFTNGNIKEWTKQGQFDDSRGGLLQKLLQSSTIKDEFTRNNKQSYADYQQRLSDPKHNSYSDSISSQLDSLLSPFLVKLLGNQFWRNAMPQTRNDPFIAVSPWSQTFSYEPGELYPRNQNPSRNLWQDLFFSERDWPERYFDEDQSRWPLPVSIMTGFDHSRYFPSSRIFRREQLDTRSPKDRVNVLSEKDDTIDQNETKTNDSTDESIRKKRFALPTHKDRLKWIYSRCREYSEQGKIMYNDVFDWICPYSGQEYFKSDIIGWWRNVYPYLTNEDTFLYDFTRNKRNNQNYWLNRQMFKDQAAKPANYQSTNNGDCRDINIQINGEIPWPTWNMLRYANNANYPQNSKEEFDRNPYAAERGGRDRQRVTILLCRRKGDQNNVYMFIKRDNFADSDVPGQDKFWNNIDWNLKPYRDDGRGGWPLRDKKEAPNSVEKETGNEVKRSTGDQGETTGIQKRSAISYFPWSTNQYRDYVYDGPGFSDQAQGPYQWPQTYPSYRNWVYSDVRFPYAKNSQVWNLWYSLITNRYSRETGAGLSAAGPDPNPSNTRSSS